LFQNDDFILGEIQPGILNFTTISKPKSLHVFCGNLWLARFLSNTI